MNRGQYSVSIPGTWTILLAGLLSLSPGQWGHAYGVSFDWALKTAYREDSFTLSEVDGQGNTVLANPRYRLASDGQYQYWSSIQKLSPQGSQLWSRTNALPFLRAVSRDSAGAICLAGKALRLSDGADMLAAAGIPTEGAGGLWLAGMAADGTVQWVRRFGPDSRDLRRLQVCFDPAGSYYALWWAQEGAFSVTKFGPTGQEVWSRSVFISTSLLHSGLAVTPDGGLLIAGTVHDQSALPTLQWGETTLSFPDYSFGFILKLDSIGNLLWTAQPEGVGRIESLASDKLGNAYVAYELSDYNPGLAKFSPSGEQLWSRQGVDLSIGGAVPFPRVAVDAVGDCYFTGTFWKSDIGKMQFGDIVLSTTARAEMFLVKYSTDGDLLWATQSRGMEADDGDGGRFSDTRLSAIQPSPSGGFVLTGTIAGWVWFGNKQLIGPGPSGWDTFVVQFSDAPPPPPELQVARSNQGLVLSWPATAQGFRLQAAETLSAATAWNPLSTVPVLAGNRYTVSVPIEQAPRFFRLVKP